VLKRSCQTYVISRVIPISMSTCAHLEMMNARVISQMLICFSYFPSGVLHESNCVLMFDVLSCFCFDPHDDVSGIGVSSEGLAIDSDNNVFF
jgi:hypothetical protein